MFTTITTTMQRLAAHLGGVLLGLLVAGASAYAVTPVESEIQKLLASDGAGFEEFGISVTIAGDTALVGAEHAANNKGAAYIFVRDGAGNWSQQAKLLASDGAAGDLLGRSVALAGDTALVGANANDDNGGNSGSAYVFARDGAGNWVQQAKLLASDGTANDEFGSSVALDGDTALVAAAHTSDGGFFSGSAYVFVRDGAGNWNQQAKLLASDGAAFDEFGRSVAIAGDTALVGAYRNAHSGGSNVGAAYVFARDGLGHWTEQAKLTATDALSGDLFGQSVAIAGDTALVGAYRDDHSGVADAGSAYVFVRDGVGNWIQQSKLTASDRSSSDLFGISVALAGDTVLVGAPLDNHSGLSDTGSAYVFTRDQYGTWSEVTKWIASDGALSDLFGISVSTDGVTAIIGAYLRDDQGASSGAAYLFTQQADDQPPQVSAVVASPNPVALASAVTLSALVDDSSTGGSAIASASYTLSGGAAASMAASDGAFDSPTEAVSASIGSGLPAGVYDLCVEGTDAAGNSSAPPICALLAVYDPVGGFVTGGGWIDSPAGAYLAEASLSGKANFGFVAKYQKGKNVPSGNTEFRFRAGNLNFHSGQYEWLVVSGHRAQFKGEGTINGAGNYGFMLTSIDANLTPSTDMDLFRIKIWDKDNGDAVVYDNEIGADDSADPTTAIGGGSIVIHEPKGNK